ncbi:MAG: cyclase family protein [Kineosporiaceae bacterium]
MQVRRIADLSVTLDGDTPVYPGDPAPHVAVHATLARDGYNLLALRLGSQTGTHVDAPFHVDDAGSRIDAMDLRLFAGPAVVVDAAGAAGPGGLAAGQAIGWDAFDAVRDRLRPGTIVLLRTGWDAHWGTPAYYTHPHLDPAACERLLATGVRTLLLDGLNPDPTPGPGDPPAEFPVHRMIAEVGGVIGENLRGLDAVTWPEPFVTAFPLRLRDGDGAPVRAVAMELAPEPSP